MPQPPCCFPPTTAASPSIGNAYNSAMLDGLIHGLSSRRPGRALSRSPWRRRALPGWRGHQMARRRRLLSASHRITPPASIATTRAMQLLNEFPKPTIALVHGACFGGGVGLVCCVDVAFTTRITVGITETPCWCRARADLHPYGQRHRPAAYTPLRADRRALRRGRGRAKRPEPRSGACGCHGETAIATTKSSFLAADNLLLDERQIAMLAHEGWTQRASSEGIEGTTAFRQKRKTSWYDPIRPNV